MSGLYSHRQIADAVRNDPAISQLHAVALSTMQQLHMTPGELRAVVTHAAMVFEQRRGNRLPQKQPPKLIESDCVSVMFMGVIRRGSVRAHPGDLAKFDVDVESVGQPIWRANPSETHRKMEPGEEAEAVLEHLMMSGYLHIVISSGLKGIDEGSHG